MGSFLLLVNPAAAAGRAGKQRERIERTLAEAGAEFETVCTEGPGHAPTLVRDALARGATGVAVVGGDGTMSEALGGFFTETGEPVAAGTWLGPIPFGTGGDFRKSIGIEAAGPEALAQRLMAATDRPIDVGWLDYTTHEGTSAARPFLNITSFGLGGLVDLMVNDGPKWIGGRMAFAAASVRALWQYQGSHIRLRIDGGAPIEFHASNVAVANGQFFGGGMHIAPQAKLDDGLFDVVSLLGKGRMKVLQTAPALYRGRILERDDVRLDRGAVVHAESLGDEPVLLDVDGEAPGRLPATFTIRRGIVRLRA